MSYAKPSLQLGGDPENGIPVAIIRGGKHNNDIIYLCEGPKKDKNPPFNKDEMYLINRLIDEQIKLHATNKNMRERVKNAEVIKRTLANGGNIKDEKLNDIYRIVKSEFNRKKDFEIEVPDGIIEIVPKFEGRECGYAAAPSGSGKSFWVSKYAQQYEKLFPENKIYLFSKVDDDVSLEGIKNIMRIDLDYQLVDDPMNVEEELSDCLVIFDDTDTIKDKEIRGAINSLKEDILETGRHYNTSILITSHLITNYKETRTVLNESNLITVYPASGSAHQIKYALKNYFGLSLEDINNLFKLNSRWVTVKKNYPQMVFSEHKVYLLGACMN